MALQVPLQVPLEVRRPSCESSWAEGFPEGARLLRRQRASCDVPLRATLKVEEW